MLKRWIGVLLVSVILMGVAACSTPAGRSPGQVIDDATITTKVKAKLYTDDLFKGFAVSVHTFKGTVTLTGAVDEPEQKQLAENKAQSVDGVVDVNNLLQIKGP